MRSGLRLYVTLLGAHLRSRMQYRASFLTEISGNFLVTTLDLVALFILMNRFRQIGGWNLAEVAFLYGTSTISFTVAEIFCGAVLTTCTGTCSTFVCTVRPNFERMAFFMASF